MSLNPITALSEQLQKLINERGSAAILRDHLALFKDQVVLLEKENTTLTEKIKVLQSEKEQLIKDNEELRSKIQKYEQPTEQPTHKNLLDEAKVKLLSYLSNHEKSLIPQIAQALNIGVETAKFHVQELKKQKFIKDGFTHDKYGSVSMNYSLDQEGRRFLIEQGLLT